MDKAGSEVFLGDYVSVGAFTKVYPVRDVRRVLKETNRATKRERSLPNHLVVYYVLAMTMLMSAGYREVLRWLVDGLRHVRGLATVKLLCTSGITQARQRLGYEPFEQLYKELVQPLATGRTKGAWYKNWLLVSFDGSTVDVADTEENGAAFGYVSGSRGRSAFPKLRFVSLIETGTKAIFSTKFAGYTESSEMDLAKQVIGDLKKGMLCLADRYYGGFPIWKKAAATGADLLWRVKTGLTLAVERQLSDGSYLSTLYPSSSDRRKRTNGIQVRVIEYRLKGVRGSESRYRLITTILDEKLAPAAELAALYHERWEIESALDEFKTHLRGANVVLRSKTPELVKQEFYGLLLSYFSIRALMHEAALEADEDPDRLSFLHAVRVIRRAVPMFGIFSPAALA
jgi:hypothetical protein